jgi:hypothetical protein
VIALKPYFLDFVWASGVDAPMRKKNMKTIIMGANFIIIIRDISSQTLWNPSSLAT